MDLYSYQGPVLQFDKCVTNNWRGTTYAPSERKARSNLVYQFKKETGKIPSTKITLPDKIVRVKGEE